MKKFILPLVFSIVLAACKKQTPNIESDAKEDSVSVLQKDSLSHKPSEFTSIKEVTPAQASEFLKSENKDTLYVTNFFATWCGPCVREIPHFKENMETLKNQPVKFTFVSLDSKEVWTTDVPEFVDEHGIRSNTILLDGTLLNNDFFTSNFKTWKGETIPFTLIRKGDKTEEINGSISKEELDAKLNSFN